MVPAVHGEWRHCYSDQLVRRRLHPGLGTPSDARALARHHLASLRYQLDAVLARRGLDEVTQANFENIRTEVGPALNATMLSGQ